MTGPIQTRRYNIDFYQLNHTSTPQVPAILDGFNNILNGAPAVHNVKGYIRELCMLSSRNSPFGMSIGGQFRKFRTSDLPEIGAAGGDAVELELAENQGLIERNFFVFYPDRNLIGWCRNAHANTANHFADFLSTCFGTRVTAGLIIEPDAVRRLMRDDIQLKKIEVTIPRPTNPDFYPDSEFSRTIVGLLRDNGADSIHVTLGVNSRRSDTQGRLGSTLKNALSEVLGMGASTAKAIVYDDGIEQPLDLIADRVKSLQDIDTNARFPPSETMYAAIDAAYQECQGQIDDYFGSLEGAII